MNTIYKYPFPITDLFELKMPAGSKVITAMMQNGTPCLWAEVDTEKQMETKRFAVLRTGDPISRMIRTKKYIATFQHDVFIWHLYEVVLK